MSEADDLGGVFCTFLLVTLLLVLRSTVAPLTILFLLISPSDSLVLTGLNNEDFFCVVFLFGEIEFEAEIP